MPGLMSMKATVRSSSWTLVDGISPATILQKRQSSLIALARYSRARASASSRVAISPAKRSSSSRASSAPTSRARLDAQLAASSSPRTSGAGAGRRARRRAVVAAPASTAASTLHGLVASSQRWIAARLGRPAPATFGLRAVVGEPLGGSQPAQARSPAVQQRGEAQRLAARQVVGQRLGERPATRAGGLERSRRSTSSAAILGAEVDQQPDRRRPAATIRLSSARIRSGDDAVERRRGRAGRVDVPRLEAELDAEAHEPQDAHAGRR